MAKNHEVGILFNNGMYLANTNADFGFTHVRDDAKRFSSVDLAMKWLEETFDLDEMEVDCYTVLFSKKGKVA